MPIDDAARAQIERAEALIELGREEQAVELLATVPQTDPEAVVSVNCALAFAHLRLNQRAEAHASAERAVQAVPNSTEALYLLTGTGSSSSNRSGGPTAPSTPARSNGTAGRGTPSARRAKPCASRPRTCSCSTPPVPC